MLVDLQPPSVIQDKADWPPCYDEVRAWRAYVLAQFERHPELVEDAKAFYSIHPQDFICSWIDTYDPRKASQGELAWMPFVLFKRQGEFVDFILACMVSKANGLTEKARDIGATWTASALSIWLWLFYDGASVGWGSATQPKLDRIGDMDSIFEKMRSAIKRLPRCFLPKGFSPDEHLFHQRLINPENGNTITGEIGPNIGRGGRKSIYFKDESAHYEHPEAVEAALMDNTPCQIDISSVNGLGNPFHRKREAGIDWAPGQKVVLDRTNIFVFDWSDHPEKTQEWYEQRKARAEAEGLDHIFAQEVDRNYSAAVVGTIIPAEYVKAAIDAHIKLKWGTKGRGSPISGLDVADGGGDTNAQAIRDGVILEFLDEWGARDVAQTARRAVTNLESIRGRVTFEYDAVGVGSGIKAELNNLEELKKLPKHFKAEPWFGAASPLFPDDHVISGDRETPLNREFYANLKAQGWWQLRLRFERTWRAVTQGETFDPEDMISLDSEKLGPLLNKLVKELSQPTKIQTATMKLQVDKTPEGTKSPNLADAVMMCYWPAQQSNYDTSFSWV